MLVSEWYIRVKIRVVLLLDSTATSNVWSPIGWLPLGLNKFLLLLSELNHELHSRRISSKKPLSPSPVKYTHNESQTDTLWFLLEFLEVRPCPSNYSNVRTQRMSESVWSSNFCDASSGSPFALNKTIEDMGNTIYTSDHESSGDSPTAGNERNTRHSEVFCKVTRNVNPTGSDESYSGKPNHSEHDEATHDYRLYDTEWRFGRRGFDRDLRKTEDENSA